MSTYAYLQQDQVIFKDPKIEGWFKTEDRGKIENGIISMMGRGDAVVKVGGENVDLAQLENQLQALKMKLGFPFDVALMAVADERLGHSIHLASDSPTEEALYLS